MASSSGGLYGFPPLLASGNHDGTSLYLTVSSPNGSLSDKNIFLVDKSIRACATVQEIKKNFIAGTYTVKVASMRQAEQLKKLTVLADQTPVQVAEDTMKNTSRAVITCRDLKGIPEKEIVEEMNDQGVVLARHFKRRHGKERVDTGSVLLTFNKSMPPEKVKVACYERIPTRKYYPPPTICYECFAYGHVATKCKEPKSCFNCAEIYHGEEIPCPNPTKCKHCVQEHPSTSRLCPVWKKEESIIRLKIDKNISATAARRLIEGNGSATFNSVVTTGLTSELSKKEEELKKKEEDIKRREVDLEKRIKLLEDKGSNMKQSENKKNREIEERLKKMEEMMESQLKTIEKLTKQIESKDSYIQALENKIRSQRIITASVESKEDPPTAGQELKRSRKGRSKAVAIPENRVISSESDSADSTSPTTKTLLLEISPSQISESELVYLDEESMITGDFGPPSPARS